MKYLLLFLFGFSAVGADRFVQVDTNHTVTYPTDLWMVNSNAIVSAISGAFGGGGGGSGTAVSVGGTYGAQVNIASTAEIAAALVGTNGNLTLVDGSIGTNRLSSAALASLLNLTNHFGTIGWSVVTGTPTTRTGYGITDAQPLDAELTSLASVTWATGDFAWYDGTKLTNFLSTSTGRSLLSSASSAAARTNLGLVVGVDVQAFDSDLSATAGLTGTGLMVRTGTGTQSTRTITGTSGRLTVSNGDGVSGNPTLDMDTNSLAASINSGSPNGSGAFVHWSKLVGVPAGFADNTDDGSGGGVTANLTTVTNFAGTQYIGWAVTNGMAYPVLTEPSKFYDYYDDLNWAVLPTTGPIVSPANGAGAGASIVASETNACGIVRLSTGTTATGNNRLQVGATASDSIVFGTNNFSKIEFRARLPVLSNGTDRYIARGGFYDVTSGNATDGAYFEYTDNVNSGNWVGKVYSNSSLQSTNLTVGPTAAAWQKLEVQVDGNLGYAYFFVDGTLQATITTGIPLGASRGTGTRVGIESTVGANADLMEIDYLHTEQFYTPAR